jgi:phospholipase D1/2
VTWPRVCDASVWAQVKPNLRTRNLPALSRKHSHRSLVWKLLLVCAIVIAGALVWLFTPLGELARPQEIVKRLETIDQSPWAPFIFVGIYLVGGLVMFPVTVLGAAVAIIFTPLKAVAVSFTGITLSAALHHWIGSRFLRKRAPASLKRIRERLDEALEDKSVITIAALRMVPIAPFTLVNLVAGCMDIRRRDFILGTALGLAPSITVVCLFGRQVRAFWKNPTTSSVLMIGAVLLAWVCVAIGMQWFVSRHKKGHATRSRRSAPAH